MRIAIRLVGVFLLWIALALPAYSAATNSASFTWYNVPDNSLDMTLTATRCMGAQGSQDLNVLVNVRPGSGVTTGATITGTMYRPNGGTDSLTFPHVSNGVYSYTYDFNQSGTYKLVLRATQLNYASDDLNEYVYVQDFNFNVTFSNNLFSVEAGSAGTVQNYVYNSDNNAVTGLTGVIDINYPSGSSFVTDGIISETGSGYYYYSFTAPSTDGVYTVSSTFTCNTHTDTNSGGRFTVYGSGGDTGGTTTTTTSSGSGGGGGSGSSGTSSGILPFDAEVIDVLFDAETFGIGDTLFPRVVFSNSGKKGSSFLVKTTISQAENAYFFNSDLSPFLAAGDSGELILRDSFSPQYGGSHVVRVEVYTPDGKVLLDTFSKVFNVDGLLRFDLVATCLDPNVRKGFDSSARFNLINLGDYFQDIQFAWWATSPTGKRLGYGTFPLALYREESRSLVRAISIPSDAELGEYVFHGQLKINGSVLDGQCSFTVQDDSSFFEGKLDSARVRLEELSQLIQLKGLSSDAQIQSKLSEARVLVGLFSEAVLEKDFSQSEKLSEKLDAVFADLSQLIQLKSSLPLEWILAGIISVLLMVIFILVGRVSVHHVINVQKHSPRFGHENLPIHTKVVQHTLGLVHPNFPHEHGLHPAYEKSFYAKQAQKHDSSHAHPAHHSKKMS